MKNNKLIKKTIEASKLNISKRQYEDLEIITNQALKTYPENLNFKCLDLIAKKNLNKDFSEQMFEIKKICSVDFEIAKTIGLFFLDLEEIEIAKEFFNQSLEINDKKEGAWIDLGVCHRLEKNFEKSLKCFEKAYQINKKNFTNLINIAGLYAENLLIENSIDYLKKALRINLESSKAHVDLGMSYYLKGDFEKAFKHYQYRFEEFKNLKKIKEIFDKKEWKKWQGENIEKESIVLFSEQGIGDCINFIRFVENFKTKFKEAKIKLIIPEQVDNLSFCKKTISKKELIIDKNFKIEKFKKNYFYCSVMDLPYYLKINKKEIKEEFKPYVFSTKKCDYSYFKNMFKIGICWAGNPKHARDKERSCNLEFFKNITEIPNVKIFSLQKELRSRIRPYEKVPTNLAKCEFNSKIVNMSPHMKTWEDTASIVDGLDLIISVDTSILHLACAMGKKTFGLLPFFPDWRWELNSEESYWYPTLKLFRQPKEGDWDSVFKSLAEDVIELTNKHQNNI